MEDQKNHLKNFVREKNILLGEISNYNSIINSKREQLLKIQGIIEYLNGIGVNLETDITEEES